MGNVILGLLLTGPQTLYSLRKHFERVISLFYSASLGSLRTAVLALEERGLVTASDGVVSGRNRRTYAITDAGRAAFREWMASPITGDLERTALAKLFFLGHLPAAERPRVLASITARVENDEAELIALARQLDSLEVPERHRDLFRYQRLVLDYGLLTHRVAREFFAEIAENAESE
ncbi:MAG: PadR family transcriptional regulator [Actinomycetes bacterium]|nr:PadR family transcriptional regulator [Actinomycetes bacterium]MDX5380368.1 PadR family transcriptional regulator [Actinomycetes bacterium]MDX5399156.1 PadR family transcriptional regulator [Actinomycetes bacterium]MDX5450101.1 PadR family transcriptional regulator [Actinomycetes bacterium]